MKIYTVGYEGCDIDEFTAFLKKEKIRHLADVRKNPVSRKKGFSKNKLAEALSKYKISYLHLPNLGVPSAWRKLAKEEIITRKKMFADYKNKILPLHQEDLTRLIQLAQDDDLAILCYEAEASDCHRSYVTDALIKKTKKKIKIENLVVPLPKYKMLGSA